MGVCWQVVYTKLLLLFLLFLLFWGWEGGEDQFHVIKVMPFGYAYPRAFVLSLFLASFHFCVESDDICVFVALACWFFSPKFTFIAYANCYFKLVFFP